MELLGVGPMELFFIIILALIILGPRDMQKAGKTLGRWMNQLVRSDTWKLVRQASNKIKYLPNELMRDASFEDIKITSQEISKKIKNDISQADLDISREMEDPFKAWREQYPETISLKGDQQNLDDKDNQQSRTGENGE